MPLQNGRAIKATAKYQDESDSGWWISDGFSSVSLLQTESTLKQSILMCK